MLKKSKKSLKRKAEKTKTKKQTSSKPKSEKADVLIGRHQMIKEAAYFRAEERNFIGGDPVEDWLAAEAEI